MGEVGGELPFSPETLAGAADRMAGAVAELGVAHPDGEVVVVSHQDPIQALRRRLLGRGWEGFHDDKPAHAAVITLHRNPGGSWVETGHWQPGGGEAFPPPPQHR